MNTPKPKFFSDSYVLRQVGRPLLTHFFDSFARMLPSKHFLPSPRPDNEHYFDSLGTQHSESKRIQHPPPFPRALAPPRRCQITPRCVGPSTKTPCGAPEMGRRNTRPVDSPHIRLPFARRHHVHRHRVARETLR